MKKVFKMDNLDCAVCAAKMEEAVRKIEGVESATVSFLTQKISIDAEESEFPRILAEAQKQIKRVNRGCSLIF